jgi:hypothetical protein
MKRVISSLFLSLLLLANTGFAEDIILDNQTSYPNEDQKTKIAIQWADSAREVDDNNKALMYGFKLNPSGIQNIAQSGKVNLNIPEKAKHFRILAWSKEGEGPDFITNWVDVEPNKIYNLKQDHLSPTVLMIGSGC